MRPLRLNQVKIEPHKHNYVFIGFTDEEQGGVGSRFHVRQMTKEQVAATDAMVNVDTLGLGPPEIWDSHSDKRLTGALLYIAGKLSVPLTGMNVEEIGSSDGEQFAGRKIRPRSPVSTLVVARSVTGLSALQKASSVSLAS